MKQLRILTAALVILTLSSCNKLVDHIKDHLDDDDKTYRIATWTRVDFGFRSLGTFTYNANNDPVSFTFDVPGGYFWKFKYDKHKRLSETYMYEGAPYFERWYRNTENICIPIKGRSFPTQPMNMANGIQFQRLKTPTIG